MEQPSSRRSPRKPIYRLRNILLLFGAILAVVLGLVAYTITRPTGKPGRYTRDLERLVTGRQPKTGANGYQLLVDAAARHAAIESAGLTRLKTCTGATSESIYGITLFKVVRPGPAATALDAATVTVRDDVAREVLAECSNTGVFDLLDGAASSPRAVRAPPTGALIHTMIPELSDFQRLGVSCGTRLSLASEMGNDVECTRAFEHGLAIAKIACSQYTEIDHRTGFAVATLVTSRLRDSLVSHPPKGDAGLRFIDACLGAMGRQTPLPPVSLAVEGDRFMLLDAVEWTHTDSGADSGLYLKGVSESFIQGGSVAPEKRAPLEAIQGLLYPGKGQTIYQINRCFDELIATTDLSRRKRVDGFDLEGFVWAQSDQHGLLFRLMPNVHMMLMESDLAKMNLAATKLMLLIERFRLRTGAYPLALADLVPSEMPALSLDPITDCSFGYKRIDPATDSAERGYILYTFGNDGVDDGGVAPDSELSEAAVLYGRESKGFDYIFNLPIGRK